MSDSELVDALVYALARAQIPGDFDTSRDYAERLAPLVIESGYLPAARVSGDPQTGLRQRAWVDGPPTEAMVRERDSHVARLEPASGRWVTDGVVSAVALAEAAFESGWDSAALASPAAALAAPGDEALRTALADIQVGTTTGITAHRIERIVRDADYALTALEKGDVDNALAALRRGFQRAPVALRSLATPKGALS